jgi:hypothetical protein
MYDTLDQWYDPKTNFTPEKPIRDMQQLFAGDDLQIPPASMIKEMVRLIPLDDHLFRNVHPGSFVDEVKKYQDGLWEKPM